MITFRQFVKEASKQDILKGLDYIKANPPPPRNKKAFTVVIDNEIPSEPVLDVFNYLFDFDKNAVYLRPNTWVSRHLNQGNAFVESEDFFEVQFIDPKEIELMQDIGLGTDRGDNPIIDQVLDALNAKYGTKF